ncbi:MAG: ABC transporter ATP-binding protein [Gammaproteobacteria bacterium]|nr:ABC transporter ATP-binding protein [Gammaproteobacteria bacterium]
MTTEKKKDSGEPVIEVEDLVTYYGSRRILDQVNLSIRAGEVMVIMGGSGSGKSTLLRHLLALHKAASGSIRLFGQDLDSLSPTELYRMRLRTGVSFQNGALFNSLNVEENVAFPLREHTRLDDNTVRIMARMKLEVVNLAGFEKLMPAQLSGGMVKRTALARAIVMDPSLLFFDEPSAGLDPVVSADLDELILRLRDAMRVTIVVVTHELDSAFRIADRILVLDKGKVLVIGSVDDVKNSDSERVQNLLNRRSEDIIVDADEYMQRLTDNLAGL